MDRSEKLDFSRVQEDNKEIVLDLLEEHTFAIYVHIHPNLKKNKDIILKVIENNSIDFILESIPKEVFDDKEFLLTCFNKNPYLIRIFPELENNKDNVLKAVSLKVIPCLYKTLSEDMKMDKDIIVRALETDGRTLHYVPDELKNDKDILIAAFKGRENQLGIINYAPNWIKEKSERFEELGNDIEKLLKEIEIIQAHKELKETIENSNPIRKKIKI